jgi:DNA-binding SARP family transcriptional activator
LAAWGEERLPAADERTAWEDRYLNGAAGSGPTQVMRRGTLRVLVPDVSVVQGEREVRLGDMQARLMAVLAAARRPVTNDGGVTALWPDAALDSGRNRLAALVHRIRQRLDLVPDELLRRTRHGLELDDRGWSIDVWDFWDLSAGSDDDRERAIELYRSDLAARQLAYDDLLQEQRDLLRERWLETVRTLVARGRLSPQEAMARAHRLGAVLLLDT